MVERPQKAALSFSGRLTRAVVNFLSSIKLAVLLLIILAGVSIIGTVLAQGDSANDNIRFFTNVIWGIYNKVGVIDADSPESIAKYQQMAQAKGLVLHDFSQMIGLDDLYRTWYFNLLLALLSLNLITCSLKHWPHTWKFFKKPKLVLEGEGAAGIPLRKEIKLKAYSSGMPPAAEKALADKGYKATATQAEGGYHLFAQKGLWGRLGIYTTHLSVLVIFLGAFIGLRYGWKGFVSIEEGSSIDTVNLRRNKGTKKLPFQILCEDFEITYYGNSLRPKDYQSKLVVFEDGKEVNRKVIEVNSPLIHRGIYFYQSSYGETGKGGKVKIRVASRDDSKSGIYEVPVNGQKFLPEFNLKVDMLNFVPDFAIEGKRIYTKSNQVKNPAAAVRLTLADGRVMSTWLFRNYPNVHSLEGADFTVTFVDYQGLQYTGLQVAYDPGVLIIWIGCTLMVIGIFMAFFVTHRRVWVKIIPRGNESVVWVAGSTNKNRAGFEEEFKAIADGIKESLAP